MKGKYELGAGAELYYLRKQNKFLIKCLTAVAGISLAVTGALGYLFWIYVTAATASVVPAVR